MMIGKTKMRARQTAKTKERVGKRQKRIIETRMEKFQLPDSPRSMDPHVM